MAENLEIVSLSHVGRVRTSNQDYVAVSAPDGIVALADGMGGHQAGEVASEIAVGVSLEALRETVSLPSMDTLQCLIRIGQAVEAANASVFNLSRKQNKLNGMGTTLVLAMFRNQKIFFAHVGDSRLYRVRDGRIRQLTKDHSLMQEVLDYGIFKSRSEASAAGVGSNVLTRSLGFTSDVNVDVSESSTQPGDYYLLCSDGLNGHVSDEGLAQVLSRAEASLQSKAEALLAAALKAGGRDNVSMVLIRVL